MYTSCWVGLRRTDSSNAIKQNPRHIWSWTLSHLPVRFDCVRCGFVCGCFFHVLRICNFDWGLVSSKLWPDAPVTPLPDYHWVMSNVNKQSQWQSDNDLDERRLQSKFHIVDIKSNKPLNHSKNNRLLEVRDPVSMVMLSDKLRDSACKVWV